MNNKKIINFIIFIPFAISLGAFVLYLKYYYALKGTKTLKVTEVIGSSLVRYRNIAIFCLFIGVLFLLIKILSDYFKIEKNINYKQENVLDRISSKPYETEAKYSFDENIIISDLLGNKKMKLKFINTNNERIVKFNNYDKKKNVIEFYDLSKTKDEVKKEKVKVKKESNFNPVKFAINMIVILLCIILLLLCINKIKGQSEINKNNLNIKTVEIN